MGDEESRRRFERDVLAAVNRVRTDVREELRPVREEISQLKADHDATMRLLHGDPEDPNGANGLVAIVADIGDSVRSFQKIGKSLWGAARAISITVIAGILLGLWNQWSIKNIASDARDAAVATREEAVATRHEAAVTRAVAEDAADDAQHASKVAEATQRTVEQIAPAAEPVKPRRRARAPVQTPTPEPEPMPAPPERERHWWEVFK